MSSKNNDDKSEKNSLNINTEYSGFKEDFFEKQNIKTQKNKINTKKTESIKQKDKDSIFSGSSNENDNNNSSEENNKEQNENNNLNPKDIIDINDPVEKNNSNNDLDNNNNKFNNNLMSINNNEKNQKEENQNISRSMSSKSNPSRSRSRSLSEKNSHSEQNKNFEQEKNNKNAGNKFKNFKNTRRQRNINNNQNNNNNTFIMKNGCCRSCMKAFSKNGKSCLCQVPRRERKFILPETGCNYCGCHGCNPIDMKYNKRLQQKNLLFQDNTINHKNQRILDSEDEDLKINDDLIDYYNRDKKEIQENLSDMLKINSIFYGFGVPLRIPSYILGYNPNVNYYYEKKNLGNNNNYMDYNMSGNMNNNNNMGGMNNNMGNNMNNFNYDLNMNNNRFNRRNNNNNYNNNNNNNNFGNYGNNFGNNNFPNNMNQNMNFNRNQRFRK